MSNPVSITKSNASASGVEHARLREAPVFSDMRLPLPHLTASFGVAVLESGMDEKALVAAADAALYRAKESGRDRVSL